MSAAAMERARDFSIDVTVDRTIAVYERALSGTSRR
jgi:hypothetical protein